MGKIIPEFRKLYQLFHFVKLKCSHLKTFRQANHTSLLSSGQQLKPDFPLSPPPTFPSREFWDGPRKSDSAANFQVLKQMLWRVEIVKILMHINSIWTFLYQEKLQNLWRCVLLPGKIKPCTYRCWDGIQVKREYEADWYQSPEFPRIIRVHFPALMCAVQAQTVSFKLPHFNST